MDTHHRFHLRFLAAGLTAVAASAWALAPSFEEMDRDGNGYISQAEARALPCLADNFHKIETESDQGLNPSEYQEAVNFYCQPDESEWPPEQSSGEF